MSAEVVITISPTGEVTLEVQGVKGSSCTGLTEQLQERLGHVSVQSLKDDYFVKPTTQRIKQTHE